MYTKTNMQELLSIPAVYLSSLDVLVCTVGVIYICTNSIYMKQKETSCI